MAKYQKSFMARPDVASSQYAGGDYPVTLVIADDGGDTGGGGGGGTPASPLLLGSSRLILGSSPLVLS